MKSNSLNCGELLKQLNRLVRLQAKAIDLTDMIEDHEKKIASKKEELNTVSLEIAHISETVGLKPEYHYDPYIIIDVILYLNYGTAHTLEEAIGLYENQ